MRQAFPLGDDKLHEECGVFGVFGHADAAALTVLGLHALQHRGQEGAGIVSYDEVTGRFPTDRRKGLVGDSFSREDIIERLRGSSAIGHVRYSTAGGSIQRNVQPMFAELQTGGLALAHNGNLTNARLLRDELVAQGAIFQSTSDTECILHLAAMARQPTLVDRLSEALRLVEGAYSLVCLSADMLVGVRDPLGVRPLVLGQLDDAHILASETCALDIIGAQYVRDVAPGEIITISKDGIGSYSPFPPMRKRFCIFELVYFAGAASTMEGISVYDVRRRAGAELAREAPVDADVIVPVPDSAVAAAIGYAQESGIRFEFGIIKNNYVGRTFIEPQDSIRHLGVKLKHNANRAVVKDKRVVLVDDSIVRGTTSKKIVQMMRDAGAREVHMRIASPPTKNSCFYGVDTPERSKLLAAQMPVDEMARHIGADSLAFVTIDGLYRAVGESGRHRNAPQFCDACFTGDYPTTLTDQASGQPVQLSLLAERA